MAESVATIPALHASASDAGVATRRDAVKAHLKRLGLTVRAWSDRHGYAPKTVYKVLAGDLHGNFGITHNIAVRLELKDGEIDPAYEPAIGPEKAHV